jgi:hypothetical protein
VTQAAPHRAVTRAYDAMIMGTLDINMALASRWPPARSGLAMRCPDMTRDTPALSEPGLSEPQPGRRSLALSVSFSLPVSLSLHDERCHGRVGTRERRGREMAQSSLLNFSCLVSGIRPVGPSAHNGRPAKGKQG